MNKPHMHAAVIKAWADGAPIEARQAGVQPWMNCPMPGWHDDWEYRIKPAAPVVETKMTGKEFEQIWDMSDVKYQQGIHAVWAAYTRIANAAIARAIADGQVLPVDQKNYVDRLAFLADIPGVIEAARAKRDMAVAKAVASHCRRLLGAEVNSSVIAALLGIDLAAIIRGVKS